MARKKFDPKTVDKLKTLLIFVKKGHGMAINELLIENGVAMTSIFFAEGAGTKYLVNILGGETAEKEAILTIVNEKKYDKIKKALENRFSVSQASRGVLLTFDIKSMVGVLAYKYLSDFGGVSRYGKK